MPILGVNGDYIGRKQLKIQAKKQKPAKKIRSVTPVKTKRSNGMTEAQAIYLTDTRLAYQLRDRLQ